MTPFTKCTTCVDKCNTRGKALTAAVPARKSRVVAAVVVTVAVTIAVVAPTTTVVAPRPAAAE